MNRALQQLDVEWRSVTTLDVDGSVALLASSLAVRHGLRGMDAIHLGSALLVAHRSTLLVTWDAELGRAARAEGLALTIPS